MKKNKLIIGGVASFAAVLGLAVAAPAVHAETFSNNDLPQNTSTTKDAKTGDVSATSNAHIDIQSGYLTLNSVPDLNFAPTSQSSNNQVQGLLNNNTGNRQSQISITDSRTAEGKAQNGWQLSAALGQFRGLNGAATDNPGAWAINLNNTGYTNSQNSRVNVTPNARLSAGGNGTNIASANNNEGIGNTTIDYSKQGKNVASLTVPANTKEGSYDAPITWTLTAGTPNNPTA
ncbi:WxL domain-containing protein [Fructilactobacillus cliffordii]|uniref:WxL domain-containing protein n=1 Tax=Fructilactobacillus cliffordii TaxID=2940299 RepID=A0A9Q9E2U7_9LACO|nr:WxL domain-containing protein [Fructilactobacillus cliffordii]USS85874.1 WxL domain-containing protein [Fructilactobacillus cliffordii]USS88943.1 WxL domain-containing protein [Fructilactobacillus cliffordii]